MPETLPFDLIASTQHQVAATNSEGRHVRNFTYDFSQSSINAITLLDIGKNDKRPIFTTGSQVLLFTGNKYQETNQG